MQYKIYLYLTAIVTFFAYLMGGYDMGIQVLLIMIALDYITGMLKALILKQLNSYVGWKGLCKKAGLLICVMVSVQIEWYKWSLELDICLYYTTHLYHHPCPSFFLDT